MKNVLAAMLLSVAPLMAVAAPVVIDQEVEATLTSDGFAYTHLFNLSQNGGYVFSLTGYSFDGKQTAGDLTISSLTFSQGATTLTFDAANDGSRLRLLDANLIQEDIKGDLFDKWVYQFAVDPATLWAGDWSVTVMGTDTNNKEATGYRLAVQPNAVPEPATLGLALAGLLPIALLRRKKVGG